MEQSISDFTKGTPAREVRFDLTRKFSFLDLPGEIRNEIYRWTLLVTPSGGAPPKAPRHYRVPEPVIRQLPRTVGINIRKLEEEQARRDWRKVTEADYIHITLLGSDLKRKLETRNNLKPFGANIVVKRIEGGLATGLLGASKRIHAETAPYLYARNKFMVDEENVAGEKLLDNWANGIGARNAAWICHLRIVNPANLPQFPRRYEDSSFDGYITAFGAMTNLKTLHVWSAQPGTWRLWRTAYVRTETLACVFCDLFGAWINGAAQRDGSLEVLDGIAVLIWENTDRGFAERDYSAALKPFLEDKVRWKAFAERWRCWKSV